MHGENLTIKYKEFDDWKKLNSEDIELVEKAFVVVYWDQRFAGNTQGNGGNVDITEFRKDIKNILLLLSNKYGSDIEIFMFGHSWGGFLAHYFLIDGYNLKLGNGWIQFGGGFF